MLKPILKELLRPNLKEKTREDLYSDSVSKEGILDSPLLSVNLKEFWVLELAKPVEDFFVRHKIRPNWITGIGLFLTFIASVLLATNHLIWAGWLVIFSGCCDFLDGRVARRMGLQSKSGGFYDSAMDRYMDAMIFFGLAYLFHDSWVLILVYFALLGSFVTPYFRAKSESLGIPCKGGKMQRPERVSYIAVGTMVSGILMCFTYPFLEVGEELPPYLLIFAIAIIAYVSNKVGFDRFWATYKALDKQA